MKAIFSLFFLLCLSSTAFAAAIQSGPQQVSLIELYSSEGCSSCPPADEWMNSLKKDKGLWKEFVPVAFHVDYWDYLGWKDPYASPEFSQRQRRYADSWGSGTVYTPGFVVNGKESRDWALPPSNKNITGLLSITRGPEHELKTVYQPAGKLEGDAGPWEVHVAMLKSGLRSDVKRGENAGRLLSHDFVVTDYAVQSMRSEAGAWTAERKPEDDNADAVAVWVTHRGDEIPIQAAGGEI